MRRSDSVEVVDTLTEVIRMQAKIIDELFRILLQHIPAEEADGLPAVGQINEAAKLYRDLI